MSDEQMHDEATEVEELDHDELKSDAEVLPDRTAVSIVNPNPGEPPIA
jgi:hypothetical protein